MKYGIRVKKAYCEDKVLEDAMLIIENGIIKKIVHGQYQEELGDILDLTEYNIIPGLVDLHIHGANGYDTMDAKFSSINEISKYLASKGITSFLPTTVTDNIENIKTALTNVYESMKKVEGAEILGTYVEGPYITEEHKGAHSENLIKELDIEEIDELIKASNNTVKVVTIAPEKKNANECIRYLTERGIQVSMGHTSATYDEASKAIQCGAKIAVHTFNGMRGFNHREPGILGAVLTKDEVYCELIADLVHVHPAAIELLLKCKDENKVILISDSMQAAGLEDGEYVLGALKVIVKDSVARVESGSLAGSTTNILSCVKNLIEKIGVDPLKALKMASLNTSKILKLDESIGSIKEGKKANLVVVDDNFNVIKTIINGIIVYNR
ncbi:N-acetylglucosamine-6-phosphate deacetylase [Clostridium brassicae]|uniref:N-acetylglucosamine-6-phosphate deacetylase n=1 Tax=Clostridium brassicae TaxID=2999072 RepID=A0ABT4DHT4_9CLOT|nr:N-acetylglucosamine-6-phosphate deacetylase [Clostridium brassicae]MCY6960574.1 N-acetylglucosamine-6-phosphate deacetylase [Clostridium brassicae]